MTRRVVLDANVLVANFRCGNDLKLLIEGARSNQLLLVVPELVIKEAAKTHREHAAAKLAELRRAASGLARLGYSMDLAEIDCDAGAVAYEIGLRRLVKDVGAVIPRLPDVTHGKLVEKALSQRKPFHGNDSGYRDALIWETVLEQATHGPTSFCTLNFKHFADPRGQNLLATELIDEVIRVGLTADRVALACDLGALVRALVDADVVASMEVDRMIPVLEAQLADALGALLIDYEFDSDELRRTSLPEIGAPSDVEAPDATIVDAHVVNAYGLSHIGVEEVFAQETQLLLSLYAEIEADLDLELALDGRHDDGYPSSRGVSVTRDLAVSIEATYLRDDEVLTEVSIARVRIS
jgi:hypothetical protein